ncbi:MAG: hypothetical protein HUK22_06780 [Thermoguttaceae bacterium]|nr:hypothetical protein [Thermoguttaceae bacterium]
MTAAVSDALSREFLDAYVEAPIADGKTPAILARDGEILSREYSDDGRAIIHCRIPKFALERLRTVPGLIVRLNDLNAEPFFSTTGDN